MDKYRYYIDGTQVYPLNADSLNFPFGKQVESSIILEMSLDTELLFKYQSGSFNFKQQETNDRCKELNFLIERRCAGSYVSFFEGLFCVSEGSFDDNKCIFKVKARVKRKLLEDLEVNILDAPEIKTVTAGSGGAARTYVNGRSFESVVLYIAQKANPQIAGIISDFFQINPITPSTFCLPGITNYWTKMVFCNLSDIQEPIPSNLSTRGMVTFKDLMDDLYVLFEVRWYIDNNYNLRIEHESQIGGVSGIDLTLPKYEKWMKATDRYSYDLDGYVKEESWKILNHDTSAKFIFSGISNIAKEKNEKSYSTKLINTDYYKIRYVTGGESQEGIFLFATDGSGAMLDTLGQNMKLSPDYLVTNLHTYNRSDIYSLFVSIRKITTSPYNIYRGGGIILNSIKPTKKQDEVSFPLCCDDEFDIMDQVQTGMGLGKVEKASFSSKDDMIKMSLKYSVDNCSNFQPSDLSGLQLWLKFNEGIIQSGGNVSQWTDFSGNNRHAVQSGTTKPTWNNVTGEITFNSSLGQHLKTPSFQIYPGKRGTIITLKRIANIGGQHILSTFNGGTGVFFDFSYNGTSVWDYTSLPTAFFYLNQNIYGAGTNDGFYCIKRISDSDVEILMNGTKPSNYANPYNCPNVQPDPNPLFIGYNPNNNVYGPYGSMVMNEVIIYDRVLTDYEVEQIQFYLVKKGIYTIS